MLTVMLGGARSGKSALAVRAMAGLGAPVTFIATAKALDEEFAERIERHRRERPVGWNTVEEPIELTRVLEGVPTQSAVIIDCLTLWVNNLTELGLTDSEIVARANELAGSARLRRGATFVVSNEVGSGIVPGNFASRRYRDLLGAVNARFAEYADEAFLVVAGRVLRLGGSELIHGPDSEVVG